MLEKMFGSEVYGAALAYQRQAAADYGRHRDTIAKLEGIAARIRALKNPEIPLVRIDYEPLDKSRQCPFVVVALWVKSFPDNTAAKQIEAARVAAYTAMVTALKLSQGEKDLPLELDAVSSLMPLAFTARMLNELETARRRRLDKGRGRLGGLHARRQVLKDPPLKPAILRGGWYPVWRSISDKSHALLTSMRDRPSMDPRLHQLWRWYFGWLPRERYLQREPLLRADQCSPFELCSLQTHKASHPPDGFRRWPRDASAARN